MVKSSLAPGGSEECAWRYRYSRIFQQVSREPHVAEVDAGAERSSRWGNETRERHTSSRSPDQFSPSFSRNGWPGRPEGRGQPSVRMAGSHLVFLLMLDWGRVTLDEPDSQGESSA